MDVRLDGLCGIKLELAVRRWKGIGIGISTNNNINWIEICMIHNEYEAHSMNINTSIDGGLSPWVVRAVESRDRS